MESPEGKQGIPGNNGHDGINGKDGNNGHDGTNGANGKDGRDGQTDEWMIEFGPEARNEQPHAILKLSA